MSTAGGQAAGVVPLLNCWPGRQPCPLGARSISSCAARRSSNSSQPVLIVIVFSLASGRASGPGDPEEHRSDEHYSVPSYAVHYIVNIVHSQPRSTEAGMDSQRQAAGRSAATLWFNPPGGEENRRHVLTRGPVVAEALAIISAEGAAALSMRALATRLGVVPAALYRHVGSKEQLYDLVLDRVLAEVDCQADPALPWTGQVIALARRLRAVLEDHPGIAALLQTRDPISPASLALAEAFLAPLHAVGLPGRQAALAFRLIYDYTLGFALSDPTSPGEQRVQDTATRAELHAFLRSLPASRFPALAALGAYAWADDRDQRFTASLDTLIAGLQAPLRPRTHDAPLPRPGRAEPGAGAGPAGRRGP